MVLGPNTLVGLATLAPGADKSVLVARLVPAYVDLLEQLKARAPPSHRMPTQLYIYTLERELPAPATGAMMWVNGFGRCQHK